MRKLKSVSFTPRLLEGCLLSLEGLVTCCTQAKLGFLNNTHVKTVSHFLRDKSDRGLWTSWVPPWAGGGRGGG